MLCQMSAVEDKFIFYFILPLFDHLRVLYIYKEIYGSPIYGKITTAAKQ